MAVETPIGLRSIGVEYIDLWEQDGMFYCRWKNVKTGSTYKAKGASMELLREQVDLDFLLTKRATRRMSMFLGLL